MSRLEPLACRSYVAAASAYLEGELDEVTATAVEEHTIVCHGCGRYMRQMQTTLSLLTRRPSAPPSPRVGTRPAFAGVYAYKFLGSGRVGPFSGYEWPEDTWVSISGPARVCRRGIHACASGDLPRWLNRELWVIELAEPVTRSSGKLVSVGGRLERRVSEWTDETALRFAQHCAMRVRDRALEALQTAGDADAADSLAETPDDDLAPEFERLAQNCEPARAICHYAAAALKALGDPPMEAAPCAAYTAALAAAWARGDEARREERTQQALWLERELGLPPTINEPAGKGRTGAGASV